MKIYGMIAAVMLANINIANCAEVREPLQPVDNSKVSAQKLEMEDADDVTKNISLEEFTQAIAEECKKIRKELKDALGLSKGKKLAGFLKKSFSKKKQSSTESPRDIKDFCKSIVIRVLTPIDEYRKTALLDDGVLSGIDLDVNKIKSEPNAEKIARALKNLQKALLNKSKKPRVTESIPWTLAALINEIFEPAPRLSFDEAFENLKETQNVIASELQKSRQAGKETVDGKVRHQKYDKIEQLWKKIEKDINKVDFCNSKKYKVQMKEIDKLVEEFIYSVDDALNIKGRRQIISTLYRAFLETYLRLRAAQGENVMSL